MVRGNFFGIGEWLPNSFGWKDWCFILTAVSNTLARISLILLIAIRASKGISIKGIVA
jgi:hypothetical protein